MLSKSPLIALLGALATVAASSSFAVPLHYEISGGSVTAHTAGSGLLINTSVSPGLAGTHFTLDDGESTGWMNFFKIWTDETTINSDDLAPSPISVTLMFNDPFTSAITTGETVGETVLWGLIQGGTLSWDGPTTVSVADRTFAIQLEDVFFNWGGPFMTFPGQNHGATVPVRITQTSSRVPDTASTFVLFGAALIAIGIIRRKKIAIAGT